MHTQIFFFAEKGEERGLQLLCIEFCCYYCAATSAQVVITIYMNYRYKFVREKYAAKV